MASELIDSTSRVRDFLFSRGLSIHIKEFSSHTRTAQEAADSIGCSVSQIAKSLVFREETTDLPILVIASGSNRVDLKKIQQATGLKLGRASAKYVKQRTGYTIGGVPPVAHNKPLETLLDSDLKKHAVIWASAGTPFAVFQLKPDDLNLLTKGTWVDLSEEV
jgi:Cys-tRNA(Pro) deacylase